MEWAAGLIGVVVGSGVTAGVAYLERHWRRKDVRAAEKRARLEEEFKSVRRYAAGLQQFVHDAVMWMKVWEAIRAVEGVEPSRQLVQKRLQDRWNEVEKLEPQPGPWFMLPDMRVKAALQGLQIRARLCQSRCEGALEAKNIMSYEDANRFAAEADENLNKMLECMEEALQQVEG